MSAADGAGSVAAGGTGSYQSGSLGSNPTVAPIDLTVRTSDVASGAVLTDLVIFSRFKVQTGYGPSSPSCSSRAWSAWCGLCRLRPASVPSTGWVRLICGICCNHISLPDRCRLRHSFHRECGILFHGVRTQSHRLESRSYARYAGQILARRPSRSNSSGSILICTRRPLLPIPTVRFGMFDTSTGPVRDSSVISYPDSHRVDTAVTTPLLLLTLLMGTGMPLSNIFATVSCQCCPPFLIVLTSSRLLRSSSISSCADAESIVIGDMLTHVI